jgi:hypothetical protein
MTTVARPIRRDTIKYSCSGEIGGKIMYIIGLMTLIMGIGLLIANFAAAMYVTIQDEM